MLLMRVSKSFCNEHTMKYWLHERKCLRPLTDWWMDWWIDWLLYSTSVPKILLDKIFFTFGKNANITLIQQMTSQYDRLTAHQSIKATCDSEEFKKLLISVRWSGCPIRRLLWQMGLTVDIFCLPVSTQKNINGTLQVIVNNVIIITLGFC